MASARTQQRRRRGQLTNQIILRLEAAFRSLEGELRVGLGACGDNRNLEPASQADDRAYDRSGI